MLHIGEAALSGRLLNLQGFVGQKGSGFLHPGVQKFCLRAAVKKFLIPGKKLALGETALPAEPFHTPVFLTAGEHSKPESLKFFF